MCSVRWFPLLVVVGCAPTTEAPTGRTLVLGAYTTPREAYHAQVLPGFAADWLAKTGEEIRFEQSYQASGAQTRAVLGGFEADVVALSLAPDVQRLVDAGLVSSDWRVQPHEGMVTRSLVVLAVRAGNPKQIRDWTDLAREDVVVITPNVRTSGGAMWNVAAIYGAAMRGKAGTTAGDAAGATELLAKILRNVKVMDKGARESLLTFEQGVGDVAITYENEVLGAKKAGKDLDYVVPPSTLLIENPVAVVDRYAASHGNEELARALVSYLHTAPAQAAFAAYGLRPVDAAQLPPGLPMPADLFTVADLGGWEALQTTVFDADGVYDQAAARARMDR